ncbi:glycosyltransferase family 39 protein, partial [Halobium palmae]
MRGALSELSGRAKRQVADDLAADPYLPYLLLLAAVMTSFWFWHRVPNFATRDERWRVLDPLVAVGTFAQDPSIESIRQGTRFWRPFGATFYLYGIVLLPVFAVAFATGELAPLAQIPAHYETDLWTLWNGTPGWIWTWSILLARIANAALAVGCVYVTYRIGTEMRDRATGRLAALLLTFTWGLLVLAHEVGEDVPALFSFLLVVYFGLLYVETGEAAMFLAASAAGGAAIAFKLTTGVAAVV